MGKVTHFEIPYDDAERAQAFYRQVFGWQIRDIPEVDYTMISTGPTDADGMPAEPGYIGGGMAARAAGVSGPVITIEVPSIDDAARAVVGHGGAVAVEKIAVGDMGFVAYITDSEGNTLRLWEAAASP